MEGGNTIKKLREKELEEIKGGGVSFWVVGGIIALGAFLVGVFEGITNPEKCG